MSNIRDVGHRSQPQPGRNRVLRSPNQLSPQMLWGEQRLAEIAAKTPDYEQSNLGSGIPEPETTTLLAEGNPTSTAGNPYPSGSVWATINTSGWGLSLGDALFWVMHADQYSGFTYNGKFLVPSGWTEAFQWPSGANTRRGAIFVKAADAADVAGTTHSVSIQTFNDNFANQGYFWGGAYQVRGLSNATIEGTTAGTNAASGTPPSSFSVAAPSAGDWSAVVGVSGCVFGGSKNAYDQSLTGDVSVLVPTDIVDTRQNWRFVFGIAPPGGTVDVSHSSGTDSTQSLAACIPIT